MLSKSSIINSKVTLTCKNCGKVFVIKAARFKTGRGKFCSVPCKVAFATITRICETCGGSFQVKRWQPKRRFCSQSCAKRGRPFTEEHSRKIGDALRGKPHSWNNAEWHNLHPRIGEDNPNFGKTLSEEARENIRQARLAYIQRTPIELRRRPESFRKLISGIRKQDWQNPEYVAKLIKAMAVKPNQLEQRLMALFAKYFPQFKYNGDFSQGVMLGGLTPDFVNVNGKKQVIEVFGDYWHSPELVGDDWRRGELGKIMIYNSLGYRCLVIWERELKEKSETEIVDMIKAFTGGRKCRV